MRSHSLRISRSAAWLEEQIVILGVVCEGRGLAFCACKLKLQHFQQLKEHTLTLGCARLESEDKFFKGEHRFHS